MWSIVSGPELESAPGGRDSDAFVWLLERDDDGAQHTMRVEASRTALCSSDLPHPIPEVIDSKGALAVLGFVEWREPPSVVTVSTTAIRPMPGSLEPNV
jgi:hypothetical protein